MLLVVEVVPNKKGMCYIPRQFTLTLLGVGYKILFELGLRKTNLFREYTL